MDRNSKKTGNKTGTKTGVEYGVILNNEGMRTADEPKYLWMPQTAAAAATSGNNNNRSTNSKNEKKNMQQGNNNINNNNNNLRTVGGQEVKSALCRNAAIDMNALMKHRQSAAKNINQSSPNKFGTTAVSINDRRHQQQLPNKRDNNNNNNSSSSYRSNNRRMENGKASSIYQAPPPPPPAPLDMPLEQMPRFGGRNGLSPRPELIETSAFITNQHQRLSISPDSRDQQQQQQQQQQFHSIANDRAKNSMLLDLRKAAPPPPPTYTCGLCQMEFTIKSLYNAHLLRHGSGTMTSTWQRRRGGDNQTAAAAAATTTTTTLVGGPHRCDYCDREFQLQRTLRIHQLKNCEKIPAAIRRCLNFTDLLHEKKPPLPKF